MIYFKKLLTLCLVVTSFLCIGGGTVRAESSSLTIIKERGVLLVGTTGDYKPMSYLNKDTGKYEGFDVEATEMLAASLGVKVQYVPTTWKTLTQDTLDNKFDIAMCGITRTMAREEVMALSKGYLIFGKTILCRTEDANKFKSLADLDKKSVRVMVNPGGTNEKFAKEALPNCTLIVHSQNAEIPELIAQGKADIMITETMEARHYTAAISTLAAPLIDAPFTKNQFGILMKQGDQIFLNYINMWMEEAQFKGTLTTLENKYIK